MSSVPNRFQRNSSALSLYSNTSTLFNERKHKGLRDEARFTWLCGLISPAVFFIGLYLSTVLFAAFIGMTCGGGISAKCPMPLLQAFASFSSMNAKETRKAVDTNNWSAFRNSQAAMLVFSWIALLSSAIGLFGFRQAHFYAFYGRKMLDELRCQIYPLYFLIPSILIYAFSFILLLFWTHFVLDDQLQARETVSKNDVASLLFYTLFPLITVWAISIYVSYGLAKSVCYIHALCFGWFDPNYEQTNLPSVGFEREIRNRSTFSAPGSRLSSFRRSKRRSTRSLGNINIGALESGFCAADPLNRSYISDDGTGTWRSQKLEVIVEEANTDS